MALAARRTRKLSRRRRHEIARRAAAARWAKAERRNEPPDDRPIEVIAAELASRVPAEEWERLPDDLIDHLDHYIYGIPKR